MKYLFVKKLILFISISMGSFVISAQKTIKESTILNNYNNAIHLYNSKAYLAAQKAFSKVKKTAKKESNLKAEATYFEAMCAIKLHQENADKKVLSFVEENPNNPKTNAAFFNVANYYFANKKAAYALKWYKKIAIEDLSEKDQKELNFKMGYAFLVTKNLTLAKQRFLLLLNDAQYGNDARYYYGFISYKLEDYGIAESTLREIADKDSYRAEISYYLLDISFKTGKFKRCVDVGLKLYPTIDKKLKSDVSKIIGESYFNLKKYPEAIPYLKKYKGKKGKWDNTDFYQLGYAYYKQKNFNNAINYFNKIIDLKNNVSQNAYYHLGECYLNLGKKTEALNAFKSAAEMSFNKQMKQDAALNYVKLSYETGNPFKPVAEVLQDFLKEYPNSKEFTEISALVVSSFLNEQNYTGALSFLKEKKSKENIAMRLEVSLYRAMQLFNESKYNQALPLFIDAKKSLDSEIQQKAQYWLAETLYRLENYTDALSNFTKLKNVLKDSNLQSFSEIDYQIGYCYFNQKEYEKAIVSFNSLLQQKTISSNIKLDALTRLGDCYFAKTDYTNAIENYSLVEKNNDLGGDYATYQIGMSYGLINNNKSKITALKKVINNYKFSNLKDDALYQLANLYTKLKDVKNAHIAYDRLVENYPKSIFLPRAFLRQGLLYYNNNANMDALMKYKSVTDRFPGSPEAIEAVANARNIYIDEGNLEDYLDWTSSLKFLNITNADKDKTTFAVAEKKYLNSKKAASVLKSLQTYIQRFPEGIHIVKANYYMADVYNKIKEFQKAIPFYNFVIEKNSSEFTEEALNKIAQIYLEQENYSTAMYFLDKLEEVAYVSENILFAQSNLMKGYYKTEAFELAVEYAKKILQKDKIDLQLENDAKTIIAREAIKNNDFNIAKQYYSSLENTATGKLKAEALYHNAYFKNQEKKYEASNKVVQQIIANYTSYKYWGVKSYVIMGKNYYGLKDIYQATFVLENVIKNFKEFKDITNEAQKELETIKENEAKTNNSVNPEKKN